MEIAQALNISVRTVEHQIYLTLLEIKKLFYCIFLVFLLSNPPFSIVLIV